MTEYIKQIRSFLADIAAKGFFHLLGANGLSKFFSFGSQLILAWIFVAEDLGRIKSMQSFLSVLIVLAGAGFNISTLKLNSENRSFGQKKFLLQNALKYTLISAVTVYLAFAFLSQTGIFSTDDATNKLLWIIAIAIIPHAVNELYLSHFQALKELKSYAYIQVFTKAIAILAIIGSSFFFALQGYVFAFIGASMLTTAALIYFKRNRIDRKYPDEYKPVENPLRLNLKYAPYSLLANFSSILSANLDIIMLNLLDVNAKIIGYYSFAKIFIHVMRIAASTVQQSTNPFFSSLAGQTQTFLARYRKYNRIMLLATLAGAVLLAITIPVFTRLLFQEYVNSIPFFLVMLAGWLFRSNTYIPSSALFGLGKINYNFYISLAGLIISAVLMYAGFQLFGAMGIAYGISAGGFFLFITNLIVFRNVKNRIQKNENT